MFQDLDATLKAVLDDANAPADLRAAEVSFETPDKDFKPSQPTVNLYLYELVENRELRDNAPIMDRVGDQYTVRRPPMRVDCTYLVTGWSIKTGALKADEEHRLLGLTLLWLGRFPVIPSDYLQGVLKDPPQLYPLIALVAQTKEDFSLGQFWSALGIAPRPAFSLTVTLTVQPVEEADQYPALKQVQLQGNSLADAVLNGRVTDPTLAPLAGAAVKIDETGQQTTTDQQGRFVISPLDFGKYTLVVDAAGRPQGRMPIDYEADRQIHNVILPGP